MAGKKRKNDVEHMEEDTTRPNTDDEEDLMHEDDDDDHGVQKSRESKKKDGDAGRESIKKRLGLIIPPSLVRRRLMQERFTSQTSMASGVFLAAALETFMVELIDSSVIIAENRKKGGENRKAKVTVTHIQQAIKGDEELANMFRNVVFAMPHKFEVQKKKKVVTAVQEDDDDDDEVED